MASRMPVDAPSDQPDQDLLLFTQSGPIEEVQELRIGGVSCFWKCLDIVEGLQGFLVETELNQASKTSFVRIVFSNDATL